MRKVFIFVALLLLLTGCTSVVNEKEEVEKDEPKEDKQIVEQVEQLELRSSVEGEFVEPGDTIQLSVHQKGNPKAIDMEDYTVILDNQDIGTISEGFLITINDDVLSGTRFTVTVKSNEFNESVDYTIRKSLEKTIDENGIVTNEEDYDVLVNKERFLPSNYKPTDLVTVSVPTQLANPEVNQLRKVAADALYQMFEGAKEDGFNLVARSGYRSYGTQEALYTANVTSKGQEYADRYSAKPGTSEHQTGLAMDITCAVVGFQLSNEFGDVPEGIWTKENAHKYGFIIRYPKGKEDIVGYSYEPWHIRYVGVELATKIAESDLTMEEYFEQR